MRCFCWREEWKSSISVSHSCGVSCFCGGLSIGELCLGF